ncbi:aldehyde dehydrogenase family protein [Sphingobium boeckii]|uniref:Acyl-CoA reductase-like NAD-dependent aldehyde dehydrogenase n=1 Tax=Sphingobium boeckii TaxID=1082345 RepID=A0A7W9AG00_9SPHN|nr:acyl-CoA reductase-like NAD-dependent aldehyde dehydrogenase [Sphingobium boeckii]
MSEILKIISPVDGTLYRESRFSTDADAEGTLASALQAAGSWKDYSVSDRVGILDAFVEAFIARSDDLARMTAWQIGRPLAKSDETGDLHYLYEYYKSTLPEFGAEVLLAGSADERRFARREPCGVNLSICAWNYPVVMLSSLILAPLLTGNIVIFKHAPQTAHISAVINEAARVAGLPEGVLQALDLTNAQCAKMLASGSIDLVNFVGSSRGGHEVRQASAAQFIREIFELGGKDAAYVMADADIAISASELVRASFSNSGQSCCSVERIYVHDAVYDKFLDQFVAAARRWTIGHPVDEVVELGPVINAAAARRIEAEVAQALQAGARDILGCPTPDVSNPDAYVTPKVLIGVDHSMLIMRAETFGPIAPIMRVRSDEDAVALMNDTEYGLTSSVWTNDIDRGLALGQRINTGNFYVNQADYVDEHLPWGGIKASGLGRTDGFSWVESLTRTKGYYARRLVQPAAAIPLDALADR